MRKERPEKNGRTVTTEANYRSLLTVNTQAQIVCSGYEFSVAMNALNGVVSEDDKDKFDGSPRDVYVRVREQPSKL